MEQTKTGFLRSYRERTGKEMMGGNLFIFFFRDKLFESRDGTEGEGGGLKKYVKV